MADIRGAISNTAQHHCCPKYWQREPLVVVSTGLRQSLVIKFSGICLAKTNTSLFFVT